MDRGAAGGQGSSRGAGGAQPAAAGGGMGGLGTRPPARAGMLCPPRMAPDRNLADHTVQQCVSELSLRVATHVLEDTADGGSGAFLQSVKTRQSLLRFALALATVRAAPDIPLPERPEAPSPPPPPDDFLPLPPAAPPRPKRRPSAIWRGRPVRPRLWTPPSFGV